MPYQKFQARASLIDRLIDLRPEVGSEVRPLRALNRRDLKEAVRRDLSWLLNTRSPLPAAAFDAKQELTVIDYGIPDFASCFLKDPDDQKLLARRIARAVTVFEPRLKQVRAEVNPVGTDEKTLFLTITAVMVADSVREPVSFPTVFQKQKNLWDIR